MPLNEKPISNWQKVLPRLEGELTQSLQGKVLNLREANIGNPTAETGDNLWYDKSKNQIFIHGLGDEAGGSSIISAANIPKERLIFGQGIRVNKAGNTYSYYEINESTDETFTDPESTNSDTVPVTVQQIEFGTMQPILGALQVLFLAAHYEGNYIPDTLSAVFDGTALDTGSNPIAPPTTNNRAIFVLCQLDADNQAFEYKQSNEYNAAISFVQAFKQGIVPLVDEKRFLIGYLKIANGQTEFQAGKDIFNAPSWNWLPNFWGFAGTTDNAILLADGTTGDTIKASAITVTGGDSFAGVGTITFGDNSVYPPVVYTQQTTDATPTVLGSGALAINELQAFYVKAIVAGSKDDYTASVSGYVEGTFRRATGGNVTLDGSLNSVILTGTTATFTLIADTVNQEIDIQVTGVAAETWNWRGKFESFLIS